MLLFYQLSLRFHLYLLLFFFFNDTATTEIYTLSLHDALPICLHAKGRGKVCPPFAPVHVRTDRKSTRLNSSHPSISYAVFCLKKKNKNRYPTNANKQNKTKKNTQAKTTHN